MEINFFKAILDRSPSPAPVAAPDQSESFEPALEHAMARPPSPAEPPEGPPLNTDDPPPQMVANQSTEEGIPQEPNAQENSQDLAVETNQTIAPLPAEQEATPADSGLTLSVFRSAFLPMPIASLVASLAEPAAVTPLGTPTISLVPEAKITPQPVFPLVSPQPASEVPLRAVVDLPIEAQVAIESNVTPQATAQGAILDAEALDLVQVKAVQVDAPEVQTTSETIETLLTNAPVQSAAFASAVSTKSAAKDVAAVVSDEAPVEEAVAVTPAINKPVEAKPAPTSDAHASAHEPKAGAQLETTQSVKGNAQPEQKAEARTSATDPALANTQATTTNTIRQAVVGQVTTLVDGEDSGEVGDDPLATTAVSMSDESTPATPPLHRAEARPIETQPVKIAQVPLHQNLERIADEMAQLAARRPGGTVRILMQPEELGSIMISVKSFGQKFDADIVTTHDQVRAAIDAGRSQLIQAVESKGLTMGNLNVGTQSSPTGGDAMPQQQGQPSFSQPRGQEAPSMGLRTNQFPSDPHTTQVGWLRRTTAVDLRA